MAMRGRRHGIGKTHIPRAGPTNGRIITVAEFLLKGRGSELHTGVPVQDTGTRKTHPKNVLALKTSRTQYQES